MATGCAVDSNILPALSPREAIPDEMTPGTFTPTSANSLEPHAHLDSVRRTNSPNDHGRLPR